MHCLSSQLLDYLKCFIHHIKHYLYYLLMRSGLFLWKSTISFASIVTWRSLIFLKFAMYLFMGSLSYLDSSRFSLPRFVTSKLSTLLQLSNYQYWCPFGELYMFGNFVWHPICCIILQCLLRIPYRKLREIRATGIELKKMRKTSATSRPLLFLLPDLKPDLGNYISAQENKVYTWLTQRSSATLSVWRLQKRKNAWDQGKSSIGTSRSKNFSG